MQKLSLPDSASAAMMLAIMRLSNGLIMAPSNPLAMAMIMKFWLMNFRAGIQLETLFSLKGVEPNESPERFVGMHLEIQVDKPYTILYLYIQN